jgi:V/A-type H+-transporting ATPase subunit I
MIVQLHKILIYGQKQELDRFFELAQRAGFLEFIGLSHKKSLELPDDAKTLLSAIKIAKKHEIHPLEAPKSPTEPVALAQKLVQLNHAQEKLFEERRFLSTELARIAPFGRFSKEDIQRIEQEGKRVFQFFCMKSSHARATHLPPEVIFVGTEFDLDYFVSINRERAHYPKMIEILVDEPASVISERLLALAEEMGRIEADIRHFSNTLPTLISGLTDYLNQFHLELAKHDSVEPLGETLFAIEAWVPETRMKAMMALLSGLHVLFEEIAIESHDRVPTCMENKGLGKVGEDLVHIYDTPAPSDRDPSKWVLASFSIFFAMIVADAGYGLIYLLLGLYVKWKFPSLKGAGRRFIKLVVLVSLCCIVWGIFTASFFGLEIGPNNPFRKTSVLHILAAKKAEYHLEKKDDVYEMYVKEFPKVVDAKNGHDFLVNATVTREGKEQFEALDAFYDNILMELSLLIGVVHLSLSLCRYLTRNWAGLGWIVFMIGGVLYFPKILNATSMLNFTGLISKEVAYAWGIQMVYGGIGLAFVAALIQKKWMAFHELTNVIQVFADVLSYIRLYALGLAGAMVAKTFNEMGMNAGLFGGALIILAGHINNLGLSVMGGVIHGLRLNFLEWYHYSFDGGGRLFNPLKLKK